MQSADHGNYTFAKRTKLYYVTLQTTDKFTEMYTVHQCHD